MLHGGILEGRRAFGNVMKYLLMGTSSNFGNMFSMAAASLFLPFLPMLPTQILLNNFLYDLAQITDSDRPRRRQLGAHAAALGHPPHSQLHAAHRADQLRLRLPHLLRAAAPASTRARPLFHTGWFVESLATQTLVLFVIRTAGNPLRSRPSRPLTMTTLGVVAIGVALPFTPLARLLGFVPLPPLFFAFLAAVTATYLVIVELVKRRLFRRRGGASGGA